MGDLIRSFKLSSLSPVFQYSPANAWALVPGTRPNNDTSTDPSSATSVAGASSASFQFDFFGIEATLFGHSDCRLAAAVNSATGSEVIATDGAGDVLATIGGLPLKLHTISFSATCSSQQTVRFDYAAVQAWVGPLGGNVSDLVLDDKDTRIAYSADWSQLTGLSAKFHDNTQHYTNTTGGVAILNFKGTAITVFGSTTVDHGPYSVNLDGQKTVYDGHATFLSVPVPIFFAAGLNATSQHTLVITNEGASYLDLDYIQVVQATVPDGASPGPHSGGTDGSTPIVSLVTETVTQVPTGGTGGPSPTPTLSGLGPPPSSSVDVAAIAGGTVGGLGGLIVLAIALMFLLRWRRNKRRDGNFHKPTLPVLGDDLDGGGGFPGDPYNAHGQDLTASIATPWSYPSSGQPPQSSLNPSLGTALKQPMATQLPQPAGAGSVIADAPPSYDQSEARRPSTSGTRPASQQGLAGSSATPPQSRTSFGSILSPRTKRDE